MPSVDVIVPFRERDPWSTSLLGYTVDHWERNFPEYNIIVSDSDPEKTFNRSAARNAGAMQSTSDVLIFCDADTVFSDAHDIEVAVDTVRATLQAAWFGCQMYFMLCKDFTEDLVQHTRHYKGESPWTKAAIRPPGGITICGYVPYERVGYYDEGFEGWGYEDSAFHAAMTAMHGPRQTFGNVFHLWHPKRRAERQDQPNIRRNRDRYQRYADAIAGGDEALQIILQERREEGTLG